MRGTDAFGVSRAYEQFFGLVESPFSLTPNTRFLFESQSHSAALEQVTQALRRHESLTVITGEVGTGKTMLCRTIVQDLEPRTFVSVIGNPLLAPDDLLKQLLQDFGLMSRDEARTAALTQHDMVATLHRFMASLISLRAHALVLIDEAQHLRPDVLEQLRLLSNFDTEEQKLLQVVLVGQLDLDDLLDRPDLRQLRQRVSRRYQLQPLEPYEVEQYIERRLWVAHGGLGLGKADRPLGHGSGEQFWRVRFTAAAMRAIASVSNGFPRTINVVCDRALERAHRAQRRVVDASTVLAAARTLKLPIPTAVWARSTPWPAAAAAAALVTLAAGVSLRPIRVAEPSPPAPVGVGATVAVPVADGARADAAADAVPEALAPLLEASGYEVLVASFRSNARADELVAVLRRLELPAYVQPAPEGWLAVAVGPYVSRDEAQDAQSRVAEVHLNDSRIVPIARKGGSPAPAASVVATTGQRGTP
ncbi:MAG: AAA family ATPase [Vicinamibacterales bacterium]